MRRKPRLTKKNEDQELRITRRRKHLRSVEQNVRHIGKCVSILDHELDQIRTAINAVLDNIEEQLDRELGDLNLLKFELPAATDRLNQQSKAPAVASGEGFISV